MPSQVLGQAVPMSKNEELSQLLGADIFSILASKWQGKEQVAGPRNDYVVLTSAILCLQSGIANVRMTDIARASGVGVATIYRHFSTKTRIAVEAATLLWQRFNKRIHAFVESDEFMSLNGAQRLERLLREYATRYASNRAFVSFLDEFDHLVLAEELEQQDLAGYGAEVDSFYVIFEDAYRLGLQDGSVVREVDFRTFYRAVAHALLGVAEKLVRGEVIPSDDASRDWDELSCIVDMAVHSLTRAGS